MLKMTTQRKIFYCEKKLDLEKTVNIHSIISSRKVWSLESNNTYLIISSYRKRYSGEELILNLEKLIEGSKTRPKRIAICKRVIKRLRKCYRYSFMYA